MEKGLLSWVHFFFSIKFIFFFREIFELEFLLINGDFESLIFINYNLKITVNYKKSNQVFTVNLFLSLFVNQKAQLSTIFFTSIDRICLTFNP